MILTTVTVHCDVCGAKADTKPGRTGAQARHYAARDGWQTGCAGGVDRCPEHRLRSGQHARLAGQK